MIPKAPLIGLAALALGAGATPALADEPANTPGEVELAKLLEGRVAGEPQRCIPDSNSRSLTVIDHTALVFRLGSKIYVNRPAGVEALDWNDVPIFERYGSQLCRQDRVQLRDRNSLIPGPYLFLADFIPYTMVDEGPPQGDVQ